MALDRDYLGSIEPGKRLWIDLSFRRMLDSTLADLEERFRVNERDWGRTRRENGFPRRSGSPPEQRKWRPW